MEHGVGTEGFEIFLGMHKAVDKNIKALVSKDLNGSADLGLADRKTTQQVLHRQLNAADGRNRMEELLLVEL